MPVKGTIWRGVPGRSVRELLLPLGAKGPPSAVEVHEVEAGDDVEVEPDDDDEDAGLKCIVWPDRVVAVPPVVLEPCGPNEAAAADVKLAVVNVASRIESWRIRLI